MSQLFDCSISDKQLVQRSRFLETVKQKVQCGELKEGDAIMADKGFDIGNDLAKLKLKLNILPFLRDKVGFEEGDVIKTQTMTQHCIYVERAIGKVRRFRIFPLYHSSFYHLAVLIRPEVLPVSFLIS